MVRREAAQRGVQAIKDARPLLDYLRQDAIKEIDAQLDAIDFTFRRLLPTGQ
jgi:hypothetical protein